MYRFISHNRCIDFYSLDIFFFFKFRNDGALFIIN